MKYPNYIYYNVRQNMGLEWNDTSMDEEIDEMSPGEVLDRFWEWEGIIGYTHTIIDSVLDVLMLDDPREEDEL